MVIKMEYENYIRSLVTDSTYDDIREDIITISVNTRRTMIVPERMIQAEWSFNSCEELNNLYYEDLFRIMSDQIAMSIDREIIDGMTNSKEPNSLPPSYLIDDINIYRKEILIKKYGLR